MTRGNRAALRARLWEVSGGLCEWPDTPLPHRAEEMAHLEGIGMGGRPSADRLDNVAALCRQGHLVLDEGIDDPYHLVPEWIEHGPGRRLAVRLWLVDRIQAARRWAK